MSYETVNGVLKHFGPEESGSHKGFTASTVTYGQTTELVIDFDLTAVANIEEFGRALGVTIPANSAIREAILKVQESAAGSSGVLDIGLTQLDDGVADVDGLFDGLAQGSLTAGTWHIGNGQLLPQRSVTNDGAGTDPVVETQPVSNAEACVVSAAVASGSFSGGSATLIIRYIEA